MEAFDKIYLEEIVETQGVLFERIYELEPDIDVEDFINKYMSSKLRYYIDEAYPYYATKNYDELYNTFKKDFGFKPKYCSIHHDEICLKWIGEFFAYYQWYTGIPSKTIIQLHSFDSMTKAYGVLHDLDRELAVQRMASSEKVIGFHNENCEFGFLSNWYPAEFTDSNGISYTSVEQYMMYHKAKLFKDTQTMNDILKTNDPDDIKSLGRKVSGYNDSSWCFARKQIVQDGVRLKFEQNELLRTELLATGNTVLAECSVSDKIWGIGLPISDDRYKDLSAWKGTNLLGQCLMYVRDSL